MKILARLPSAFPVVGAIGDLVTPIPIRLETGWAGVRGCGWRGRVEFI